MKRSVLLNAEISMLVASMGHGDMVVVGDAGLPIPVGVGAPQRIDLALCPGVPSLDQTLTAILSELHVEQAFIAHEALQGEKQALPAWCASRTRNSRPCATAQGRSFARANARLTPTWCSSLA
jgi:D-ribose pyranase